MKYNNYVVYTDSRCFAIIRDYDVIDVLIRPCIQPLYVYAAERQKRSRVFMTISTINYYYSYITDTSVMV